MADDPESSLNPHAPEYIPIPNPPPRPPTYVLPPVYQFQPVMLPTHPYPPALPPLLPLPTVDSPPPENVQRGRQRRSIPPKLGGLEKWIPKNKTTVLIKNIPFHYNRELLMKFLDDFCLQENKKARDSNGENIHVFAYDFLYLPMNFKKSRIKGYAYVNFTDQRTLWKFSLAFRDGVKAFPGSTRSVKIFIQNILGKDALVKEYDNTRFVWESEDCLPVLFNPPRNGSRESVQVITVGKLEVIPDKLALQGRSN